MALSAQSNCADRSVNTVKLCRPLCLSTQSNRADRSINTIKVCRPLYQNNQIVQTALSINTVKVVHLPLSSAKSHYSPEVVELSLTWHETGGKGSRPYEILIIATLECCQVILVRKRCSGRKRDFFSRQYVACCLWLGKSEFDLTSQAVTETACEHARR